VPEQENGESQFGATLFRVVFCLQDRLNDAFVFGAEWHSRPFWTFGGRREYPALTIGQLNLPSLAKRGSTTVTQETRQGSTSFRECISGMAKSRSFTENTDEDHPKNDDKPISGLFQTGRAKKGHY